jgi:uncharacterized protein YdaU (DUF1376 family)
MSGPQWMPVYIGDYLRDTPHLTAEQHGAYLLILFAMWGSEDGTLPLAALPRVSKVHPARWARTWSAIQSMFIVDGDRVTQKRLCVERDRLEKIRAIRKAQGQLGGLTTAHRRTMTRGYGDNKTAPKPLTQNGSDQAIAQAIHIHIEKEDGKQDGGEIASQANPDRSNLVRLLDEKEKGWRR